MVSRKPYAAEIAELGDYYSAVLAWAGTDRLREALLAVGAGPALFIGTGGTAVIARLAADLHESIMGQPARVLTPLELALLPNSMRAGAVLFSAGLRHPDALGALRRLDSSRFRPALVVTLRDLTEEPDIVPPSIDAVVLPKLGFREGFLATTSVLGMATALIRSVTGDSRLPKAVTSSDFPMPSVREHLLVLTSPRLAPVGVDLETRFSELGLASVQLTDYRNFAHGRHVGLRRRADQTAVLALVDGEVARLADATIDALSSAGVDVTAWRADEEGFPAVLELLVASMKLAFAAADEQGVNPARPGAPPFGRQLYHLKTDRLLRAPADGPIERKINALAASRDATASRGDYKDAYDRWHGELSEQRFNGLVLDYDGTVVATGLRRELPTQMVQGALLRLLEAGVTIGFASGRGPSLHRDLRRWVPETHWSSIQLALYNGGACFTLDEDLPNMRRPSTQIQEVVARLDKLSIGEALLMEPRAHQVTVTTLPGVSFRRADVERLLDDAIRCAPGLAVKLVRSGHSIDIVPRRSSKVVALERVAGPSLAIGDQGDVGGNDYDLLSVGRWSLTVDRCSAAPDRCWYLDSRGRTGPDLLIAYMRSFKLSDSGFRVRWKIA